MAVKVKHHIKSPIGKQSKLQQKDIGPYICKKKDSKQTSIIKTKNIKMMYKYMICTYI